MSFISYLKETRNELRHVVWPTWSQALMFTALVIIISAAVAIVLGGFDLLFERFLSLFIS